MTGYPSPKRDLRRAASGGTPGAQSRILTECTSDGAPRTYGRGSTLWLRRQGRILMETVVVATRTLCVATRAKRGGTDGNSGL
jgi:hypothetical protein